MSEIKVVRGGRDSFQMGIIWRDGERFCPFLKVLTGGAVTMETGGLFQYLMTLTRRIDLLLL